MKLYVEAELPDYCYVSEAAYWLALGRIPPDEREVTKDENREYIAVNVRMGEDAVWNGEVAEVGLTFSESEFRAFGVEADHLKYVEGIHGTNGTQGDKYLEAERRRYDGFGKDDGKIERDPVTCPPRLPHS